MEVFGPFCNVGIEEELFSLCVCVKKIEMPTILKRKEFNEAIGQQYLNNRVKQYVE